MKNPESLSAESPKRKRGRRPRPAEAASAGEIAALDQELLRLIARRAEWIRAAAAQSDPAAQKTLAAALVGEELKKLIAHREGALPQKSLDAVVRELLSGCRALIRTPRIAFLGPLYSFSHLAAIHRFGQSVDFVPVGAIAAVFEEVQNGHSDYGLVPVENSTDGRIADSLDMFSRMPLPICGAIDLRIHHTLLGKCPRSEVREVYSKPQGLSQCRNWLAKHLPAARSIEVTSTSMAAQLAAEKPGAAAIASLQAGVHYGLDVLAENIEDNPGNTTRFAVIGGQPPERTGNDRTAMLFQVEHRPGALAEAMQIFKRNRLNLTWIESFPIPGTDRIYLFFVEMEGHRTDARFRRMLTSLQRKTLRLEILGSFPAATVVD
ncbi:MAG: prephenate dehydratase [Pirellulales bacterium]|nr:prephenate dehydratase [Pirellulales bacterium]